MDETPAQIKIERVLDRCDTFSPIKLADYVRDYFVKSEKELACMPGTPSQVMAAQFVLHARLAVDLTEVHTVDSLLFAKVVDVILRSPNARSKRG